MYDYSPETCLIKDVDGQLYNIIDLWRGIKQPVDPSTIKKAYAPRTCLVENIDGTTVNIIDTILTVANGSGAGTSCLQEVIQARNEYKTLDERLDTENMKIYETLNSKDYLSFKGEYITVPHSKVGYTKGLKIQGKTYQNLFGGYENLSMLNASYNEGVAIFTPKPQAYCNLFDVNNRFYKTSTTYTIIIDIIENTLTSSSSRTDLIIGGDTLASVVVPAISFNILNVTGRVVKKAITRSDFSTIKVNEGMRLFLDNQFDGGVLKFKIMVLEGDYTTPGKYIPPYFEGIKSVGEEENNKIDILSTGKNLFDINKGIKNIINGNLTIEKKGSILKLKGLGSYCAYKFNFNLKPNTSYTLKRKVKVSKGSAESGRILVFEDSINTHTLLSDEPITFIPKKSNVQLSLIGNWGTNSEFEIDFFELQLEEGTQATSYEPYQSYNKETLLPYNYGLKGLSDTVCDEIVDNKVIQRVDRVVLNGSENWGVVVYSVDTPTANTMAFQTKIKHTLVSNNLLSDTFYTKDGLGGVDEEGITYNGGDVFIRIKKSKLSTQDVQGFKKYLQANPVTVYYELAEPVTHNLPIDNREMKTYDGITHISSSNAINPYLDCQAPSNPQAVVADLMVANESLSNELDVKTKELQAKDEHLMNENDLLTAKDLDMDFRIFELEEQLTPEVVKLSLSHNSPYLMIERCIEKGLYEKEDMLYKMGRYLHGKRLTQEEYDKLKLMMG